MRFGYNKQADQRDQGRSQDLRTRTDYYHSHSEQHLFNALRFAQGCSGSEARVRADMIREEILRRSGRARNE
jgi:hypothetical protein